ncbi:hypothetical protein ABPG77_000671 [Micractinium sp. CCAP 211/92]
MAPPGGASSDIYPAAVVLVGKLSSFFKGRRKQAAAQLRILADLSPENQSLIAAAGAIPPLIKLLAGSSRGCQELAAAALGSLSMDAPAIKAAILEQGGIPPLVRLLRADAPPKVQAAAAGAVRSIAVGHGQCRSAFEGEGALPRLAALTSSSSEAVSKAAASALRVLRAPPPTLPTPTPQQPRPRLSPLPDAAQVPRPSPLPDAAQVPRPSPQPLEQNLPRHSAQRQGPQGEDERQQQRARQPVQQSVKQASQPQPRSPRSLSIGPSELASGSTSETSSQPSVQHAQQAQTDREGLRLFQLSSLKMVRLLGDKSVSSVHLAEYHGRSVVVKKLMSGARVGSSMPLSHPELAQLRNEICVNAAVSHRNCVRLYGICPDPAALITEYCELGSVADVLKKAKADPEVAKQLSWPRRLSMAIDAAKGLHALHARQPPILHRNLTSSNLLVTKDWRVKVADFNLSHALGDALGSITAALDPCWLAPEVIGGEAPTKEADIYSLGIVLWELLTWDLPWGRKPWQVVPLVVNGGRPEVPPPHRLPGGHPVPPGTLDGYTALMKKAWAQSPFDRPTLGEVVTGLGRLLEQASCQGGMEGSTASYDPYVSAAFGARVRPQGTHA